MLVEINLGNLSIHKFQDKKSFLKSRWRSDPLHNGYGLQDFRNRPSPNFLSPIRTQPCQLGWEYVKNNGAESIYLGIGISIIMKGRIIIILQMVSWLLFYECSQFWLLFSFFWTRKKLSWRFTSENKSDGNSFMLKFSSFLFDFWFYTNKLHGGRGDQGNLSAMTVFINTPLRFIVQFDICNPWTRLAVNINKPWVSLTNIP